MKHLLALFALAAATASTMAAPASVTNLIVNGGFEATAVADGTWVNVASMPGWVWLAGPGTGFEIRNNVVGRAQEGVNFIELDTNGNTTIGQYLESLTTGTIYDLSFWYAPREFQPSSTNGITVSWNGLQLGDVLTGVGGSQNDWTLHQYRVTAQSGRNLLSFSAVGTSDGLGGNLDNVGLSRSAGSNLASVPEPGSLALAFVALSSLLVMRRRAIVRR